MSLNIIRFIGALILLLEQTICCSLVSLFELGGRKGQNFEAALYRVPVVAILTTELKPIQYFYGMATYSGLGVATLPT